MSKSPQWLLLPKSLLLILTKCAFFFFPRRGSPLLIGVRSEHKLSTDHIPILYRTGILPQADALVFHVVVASVTAHLNAA